MTSGERVALRLRKNMQRAINKTTATAPPTAAPEMIPTLLLDEVLELDVDEALPIVDEGAEEVDDGELVTRHEASFDAETNSRGETPPVLLWESVIENNMFVPALTFTTQV